MMRLSILLLATTVLAVAIAHRHTPVFPYNVLVSEHSDPLTEVRSGNVSKQCMKAFTALLANLTQALFVADAIGKPAAGALFMNDAWLGNYDECTFSNFTMNQYKYCNVQMLLDATSVIPNVNIPISWGVCAPKNCSSEDVKNGIMILAELANISQYFEPNMYAKAVCSKETTYDAGFIITLALCVCIIALTLVCAFIEAATRFKLSKLASPILQIQADNVLDSMRGVTEEDDVPLIGSEGNLNGQQVQIQEPAKDIVFKLVMSFSLSSNLSKLVEPNQNDRNIACLNGLRVISMFWVVLGHTYQLATVGIPVDNIPSAAAFVNRFGFQAITNATFSVDTFFFLSGFLVGFLTFMRMAKTSGKIPWFWFYFHRFWRLTPVYMFSIVFFMYFTPYMGQGPFWMYVDTKTGCAKWWWTNLLYINNFFPKKFQDTCIGWSWYLANDMQFFVISPIFLILLYHVPIIGVIVVSVGMLASFVVNGALVGVYNLSPFLILDPTYFAKHPPPMDYESMIYVKPYCRISVYLVGIIMGYVFYRIGNRKVKMNPIVAFVGWLLAAIVAISVLYGNYPSIEAGTIPNKTANIIYATVSRFAWSVVLSWIVFACKYGFGGWINSILSWSGWIIFSRLTYTTYLVHPVVLFAFYFNFGTALHFSIVLMSVYFVGCLGISYGLAAVFSLAIEYPFANIEKLFMPKDVQSRRTVNDSKSHRETIQ